MLPDPPTRFADTTLATAWPNSYWWTGQPSIKTLSPRPFSPPSGRSCPRRRRGRHGVRRCPNRHQRWPAGAPLLLSWPLPGLGLSRPGERAGCGRDGAGPKRPRRCRQSGVPAGACPQAAGGLGPSNGAGFGWTCQDLCRRRWPGHPRRRDTRNVVELRGFAFETRDKLVQEMSLFISTPRRGAPARGGR